MAFAILAPLFLASFVLALDLGLAYVSLYDYGAGFISFCRASGYFVSSVAQNFL